MHNLRFYVLFNSNSVMLGQWEDDNERLCTVESWLGLEGFSPPAGLKHWTARS